MFHTFDLSLGTSPPARSELVSAPVARTFLFFDEFSQIELPASLREIGSGRSL
jgi:hypothetical protein